jgi:hypothetical protein
MPTSDQLLQGLQSAKESLEEKQKKILDEEKQKKGKLRHVAEAEAEKRHPPALPPAATTAAAAAAAHVKTPEYVVEMEEDAAEQRQ